jgi:hypothetical protein
VKNKYQILKKISKMKMNKMGVKFKERLFKEEK